MCPFNRKRCSLGVRVLCKPSPTDPKLIVELPPRKNQALRVRSPLPVRATWPVVATTGRARGRIPEMASRTTHAINDLIHGGTPREVVALRNAHDEEVAYRVAKAP